MRHKLQEYVKDEFALIFKSKVDQYGEKIVDIALRVITVLDKGGTLAFMGNGGSAAEASHLAAEFTGKCRIDHRPLKAISLNDNNSSITAVANDYGFDKVFSRQVEALLDENCILIALSTSGKSKNILNAIKSAKDKGVYVVLWTGLSFNPNNLDEEPDEVWVAPFESTPRVQEAHLLWGHLVSECVEICLPQEK